MGAGESRRSKFQDNGAVMTHSFKSTILAGVMTTLLAGTAMAGGFAVREQSAEGQGASFAGIAAGATVSVRATVDGVLRPPLGWNQRLPEAVGTHDYLALQHYFTFPVAFAWRAPGNLFARDMGEPGPDVPPFMGESRPEGLHDRVMWLKQFDLPIVISEHGLLENNERRRPAYMLESLAGLHRAIQDGANVRGYFHWSLIDNFEWAEGYAARFGLIHLDLATQARTIKPSGYLYSDIAAANGITREMAEKVSPVLAQGVFGADKAAPR